MVAKSKITAVIAEDGSALSQELNSLRKTLFPPESQKVLRSFSSGEAAKLIGIADGYLRQLSLGGKARHRISVSGVADRIRSSKSIYCESFWKKAAKANAICRIGLAASTAKFSLSSISKVDLEKQQRPRTLLNIWHCAVTASSQ